ncbi:Shikimate O-hydroxycinnamoyltransferase [Nymphaea thermarum]|nr:Shikimate O-hydroxycinnamoyltransferase [Nymphaea thermarum]
MAVKDIVDAADNGEFDVEIGRKELVTADSPLPESWLPLSNLDLLLPPLYPSFFFVYEKPIDVHLKVQSMIITLKRALSKLIIPYFPLAGEVVTSPTGEPEIHCNNNGVEFIEAYADIELRDLHHPDTSVVGKLVLKRPTAILCLQVTELKCGGTVLSCTLDHRVSDGYSAKMFLDAWAEMATSGTISVTPTFRRSLLSPRRLGLPDKVAPPALPYTSRAHEYVGRIYSSSHGTKRTKFEAFSGCLWRAMAKSAGDGETCQMGVVVDGRTRLVDDVRSMDTMARYYGNVLSLPYSESEANELTTKPLSWVADQVHEFLESIVTTDHFLGLVDWVEAHKPHQLMTSLVYKGTMEGPSFTVSNGRVFQPSKLDFGWGKPILGSCYFPWGVDSGYVMLMPSPFRDGDWVVYMHLFNHQLDVVEAELSDFDVEVRRKELVTADSPLPESWLPLSNLDLLLPPLYPSFFFVYEKPIHAHLKFQSMISALKKALSKLLIPYFPLAGEVVASPTGEPEIHSKNNGVEFIEAYADIELRNLDLHHPDASVAGKLVPRRASAVLCLQVTELKCGAMVVACFQDHRLTDGYSANMFLEAWAEMTTSGTISVTPTFRRSLLSPRRLGLPDKSLNDLYRVAPPALPCTPRLQEYVGRIYYMKAEAMASLQALASSPGSKRTKAEAFSGCLWKALAKSGSKGESCKMAVTVNGRTRLSADAMARYYGNVLSLPYGELNANELKRRPLSWVADQVHDFLRPILTKDRFQDLVDWVEGHRPHPLIASLVCNGAKKGPSFAFSSGRIFQTNTLDFGWGRPVVGSCYFPWGADSGYVMPMPMPSPSANEDWVVYMHLLKHQLDVVEAELGDILHPLNLDHLQLLQH